MTQLNKGSKTIEVGFFWAQDTLISHRFSVRKDPDASSKHFVPIVLCNCGTLGDSMAVSGSPKRW